MLSELAPAIQIPLDAQVAQRFGQRTLDRFRNPHLAHQWLSITLQYSSKMRMRNVPTLLSHYRKSPQVPPSFALGFAAYLLFMKAVKKDGDQFYGEYAGQQYLIRDDQAGYFYEKWQTLPVEGLVVEVLANQILWDTDLTQLPGFSQAVSGYLQQMMAKGVRTVMEEFTEQLSR